MILADHYPVQRRGMAIGSFIASTSFGYALSLVLSGIALPWGIQARVSYNLSWSDGWLYFGLDFPDEDAGAGRKQAKAAKVR